jgi:hypothetical protein
MITFQIDAWIFYVLLVLIFLDIILNCLNIALKLLIWKAERKKIQILKRHDEEDFRHVPRLVVHAAALSLAITRQEVEIAEESWRALPTDIQIMIDAATDEMESELNAK